MDPLHANRTWNLAHMPPNTNIVGLKWVFRTKYKSDGSIDRYRAPLVARFTKVPGSDFHHTFSLVAKADTIRVILALSMYFRWPLHQLHILSKPM